MRYVLGQWTLEEAMEERPARVGRLKKDGKLEPARTKPPALWVIQPWLMKSICQQTELPVGTIDVPNEYKGIFKHALRKNKKKGVSSELL